MKILIRILSIFFIVFGILSTSFLIVPGATKGLGIYGPFFLFGGIGTFFFKKWGRRILMWITALILILFGFIAVTLAKDLEVMEYGTLASLGAVLLSGILFLFALYNPKANQLFK